MYFQPKQQNNNNKYTSANQCLTCQRTQVRRKKSKLKCVVCVVCVACVGTTLWYDPSNVILHIQYVREYILPRRVHTVEKNRV